MRIILAQDIVRVGKFGETIEVKEGYARNFLLPRGFAMIPTEQNIKKIEALKKRKEDALNKEKRVAEELADKLSKLSLTISVNVGSDEKLFGSVTSGDIQESLKSEGFEIDKKNILLDEPLKELGVFTVDVKVYSGIVAKLKVWVVKKDEQQGGV